MKPLTIHELRKKYIDFFVSEGHAQISGKSLIPENDPTVLFTTAGMHPLVPYLLGEPHPAGKRLTDHQKCIRTGDIDSVGDPSHLTFFEMLGNWSLGDYFKDGAIRMSFEFLTSEKWLGIPVDSLSVTVFAGEEGIARDDESASIWQSLGIPKERIYFLPREDNWWGPAGETGPCGPDTEMFVDTGKEKCSPDCRPGCHCGKYFEVWNDVFMQYNKQKDGSYVPLSRKCVDTGMGIERTVAMLQGKRSVYQTEAFTPILSALEEISGKRYGDDEELDRSFRIVSDHVRASTFILGDPKAVSPSNVGAGYVLRRLIRRAVRHGKKLGIEGLFLAKPARVVIGMYAEPYPEIAEKTDFILSELEKEEEKFLSTLKKGEQEFEKMLPNLMKNPAKIIPGRVAFKLYDTYGFPIELTEDSRPSTA
jgi:alanyl-tRNA synthetase